MSEISSHAPNASEGTAKTALVVVAHADDIEFACAGTVARWVQEGYRVTYVICTDSSKGTDDPAMTRERLAAIRVQEQRAAAAVMGVRDVIFLPHEDGTLRDDDELRRDLVRFIRQSRAERLICMDPSMRWFGQSYVNHPDHIAAGNAAVFAVYPLARNRLSFPELLAEGLEPHKVGELYLASTDRPDTWVDIGETIELKIAALREHRSQLGEWDASEAVREWAREQGKERGCEYAEAFKYFKLE